MQQSTYKKITSEINDECGESRTHSKLEDVIMNESNLNLIITQASMYKQADQQCVLRCKAKKNCFSF